MLADAIRHGVRVAERLAGDERVHGRLAFDVSSFRVEANDRLRAPNTDDAYRAFEPIVRAAVARAFDGARAAVTRVVNDPRDRLAADVKVA
jgi:hypothetical protein